MKHRRNNTEGLTAAQRKANSEKRMVAILDVMDWRLPGGDYNLNVPDFPNAIAYAAAYKHDLPVKGRLGHGGYYPGPGTVISNTLQALRRRGLITWTTRRDGLSGGGYAITQEGRAHLDANRHLLDEPWPVPAEDDDR